MGVVVVIVTALMFVSNFELTLVICCQFLIHFCMKSLRSTILGDLHWYIMHDLLPEPALTFRSSRPDSNVNSRQKIRIDIKTRRFIGMRLSVAQDLTQSLLYMCGLAFGIKLQNEEWVSDRSLN
jgi:hypothetical protein